MSITAGVDTGTPMDDEAPRTSRRQMFVGAGSVCLIGAGLAACGGSSTGTGSTGTGSTGAGAGATAAAAASGTVIVALDKVPVGGAASATLKGQDVIVSQPKAGKVVAFSAVCPHMGGTVAPQGSQLVCPLHGSIFDETTGSRISGPAPSGLTEISVAVDGKNVVSG